MDLSDEKSLDLLVKEWEVDLQTQMHFNELIMKFRTAGLTIVGIFLSAAVGALKVDNILSIGIGLAAVALLVAFWVLDSQYYFKLLIGAVNRTQQIDEFFSGEDMFLKINKKEIRLFGLTRSITDEIDKEAQSKNYIKSKRLIAWYYRTMLIAAALIFIVALIHGCDQIKSPRLSESETAINLVKNYHLQYPGMTTIEKDIQSTLSNLEGDINFLGWQAQQINRDVYIVSNLYLRGRNTIGWLFEVNLPNGIMRPINYLKEDSSLLRKYSIKAERELLTDYEFARLKDSFRDARPSLSDRDLELLIRTADFREKYTVEKSTEDYLLPIEFGREKEIRERIRKATEELQRREQPKR